MENSVMSHSPSESTLNGQIVVVIGGSAGIGLETARLARAQGARVILTARHSVPLERAAKELDALSFAAFDATDFKLLQSFLNEIPLVDHVLVTGPGPYYAPLTDFDLESARKDIETHLLVPIFIAKNARGKVRPGGTFFSWGAQEGGPQPLEWSSSQRLRLLYQPWQKPSARSCTYPGECHCSRICRYAFD
jgi:NAD(P)-dependent dehydrogenase (short-subunit alcohol dehydrogenase family)